MHPQFREGQLLDILNQILIEPQRNHFITLYSLKIAYVLAEMENPCFLDFVAENPLRSKAISMLCHIIDIIKDAMRKIDLNDDTTLEAFKVVEVFSDDSNFKSDVISSVTIAVVEFLSLPPQILSKAFFLPGNSKLTMIVLFKIIGNLHCFNAELSKMQDQNKFLWSIVNLCRSKPNDLRSNEDVNNLLLNLGFLLEQPEFSKHSTEVNEEDVHLVKDLLDLLQNQLRGKKKYDPIN